MSRKVRQLRANEFLRPILIKDIPKKLRGEEALAATVMAFEELAIAEGLRVIHGDRWGLVYKMHGGHVRFDDDGEPVLMWRRSMMDLPSPFAQKEKQ